MSLKIAYDYQIFARQIYGGISRYCSELCRGVQDTPEMSAITIAPLHINRYLSENNIHTFGKFCKLSPKSLRILSPINEIIFRRAALYYECSIIHQTYYSMYPKSKKHKTILTVYDMVHEQFPHMFPRTDFTSKAKRAAVNNSDHIICISESTKRDLMRTMNVKESKISVIYLGFSISREDGCNGSVGYIDEPKEHDPDSERFILYVGQRDGYKNFKGFMEAYSRSSLKQDFRVVSFGGPEFSKHEIAYFEQLGIDQRRVTWIGGGDRVLEKLYKNASLFIYPSLYEGFGIPPLEAMSFSCPVACSDTSSIPEVVGVAAEYFDPSNVDSIVAAMENVLLKPQRGKILKELGRKRVLDFSWKKCVSDTVDLYKELS